MADSPISNETSAEAEDSGPNLKCDALEARIKARPEDPAPHCELALLCHQNEAHLAALIHIGQAWVLGGRKLPAWVQSLHASVLQNLGRPDEARGVLEALIAAQPDDPAPIYKLALIHHQTGESQAALSYVERARSLDQNPPVWAQNLQAAILQSLGRLDDALDVLETLAAAHPGDPAPLWKRAQILRQAGKPTEALAALHAARTTAPDDPGLYCDEVDLLLDLGQAEAAHCALIIAEDALPALSDALLFRKAKIAGLLGDTGLKTAATAELCARLPDDPGAHVRHGWALVADGRPQEGLTVLETFIKRCGLLPEATVNLISLYRLEHHFDRANDLAIQAISANPTDPALLRFLFGHYLGTADSRIIKTVLERLRDRLPSELMHELEVANLLRETRYAEAFGTLYPRSGQLREPAEAMRLADALIGLHRYDTVLRYLRLCLQRWPTHPEFLTRLANLCLRLGRFCELSAELRAQSGRSSELDREILARRYALALHTDDIEEAAGLGQELADQGNASRGDTGELVRLLVTRPPSARAGRILTLIRETSRQVGWPHFGSSLNGQLKTEYLLEFDSRAAVPETDLGALRAEVRKHPGSTPRALSLIRYRVAQPQKSAPMEPVDTIPRRIVQYWDGADPPAPLRPLMQSWETLSGISYTLHTRSTAHKMLRQICGRRWAQAFNMANNPAEAADFLRLALLAQDGGIWADADDYLYGSLEDILGDRHGLVVYHEAFGGAIGNNFIAASPRHPVLIYAADTALRALEQRSAEKTWQKTGPGLLSRAVAQYLARTPETDVRDNLVILDYATVAGQIAMHNEVFYKQSSRHWNASANQQPDCWSLLAQKLADIPSDHLGGQGPRDPDSDTGQKEGT